MKTHESKPDDPWLILNATHEFVAVATWREWRESEGYPARFIPVRHLAGESDDWAEVEAWSKDQLAAGANSVNLHRTWPIKEKDAPKGHRLHGKRENGLIGRVAA